MLPTAIELDGSAVAGDGRQHLPWRPFLAAVSALAGVGVLALAVTAYVALRTSPGLRLDERLLDAVSSTNLTEYAKHVEMRSLSHWLIALLLLACGLLALVRPRLNLALGGVTVVAGANFTTHYLQQQLFTRPDLSSGANGLPSQHMTVALSLALAAVIVAPSNWRSIVAIGMSAAATLVGLALVLGRWHRPSDVIAAVFVCVAWAAVGLLVAGLVRRRPRRPPISPQTRNASFPLAALIATWPVSVLLVFLGTRSNMGLADLGLAVILLGTIGLACALGVTTVARVAGRHVG